MVGRLHLAIMAGWALTAGIASAQGCTAMTGGCGTLDARPPIRLAQAGMPESGVVPARPATRPQRATPSSPALTKPSDAATDPAQPQGGAIPAEPGLTPPVTTAPLVPAPVTTTTLPAPATERRPVRRSTPAAQPAQAAPSSSVPLGAWSLPVPAGCPSGNILTLGDNQLRGEVRGDTICRFAVPAKTARITLVGPSEPAGLRVLLYADVSTDLTPDAALPLTPGPQELRIQRRPDAPEGARPFDLTIRLD